MTITDWEQKTNKRETNICKAGTMGLSKDEVTVTHRSEDTTKAGKLESK